MMNENEHCNNDSMNILELRKKSPFCDIRNILKSKHENIIKTKSIFNDVDSCNTIEELTKKISELQTNEKILSKEILRQQMVIKKISSKNNINESSVGIRSQYESVVSKLQYEISELKVNLRIS